MLILYKTVFLKSILIQLTCIFDILVLSELKGKADLGVWLKFSISLSGLLLVSVFCNMQRTSLIGDNGTIKF